MDLGWLSNIDIGALMALPVLGLVGEGFRGTWGSGGRAGGNLIGGKLTPSAAAKVDSLRAGIGSAGVDPKDKARAQQQLRDILQGANKQRMKANESKPAKGGAAKGDQLGWEGVGTVKPKGKSPKGSLKPGDQIPSERSMTARQRRDLDQAAGGVPSPVRRPARTTRGGATSASRRLADRFR